MEHADDPSQADFDRYEIERYSKLTQNELLIEFGRVLTARAMHGAPLNDDELSRTGDGWFASFRAKVRPIICKESVLKQLQGANAHRNTIFGLVLNYLLAADLNCPVPLGSAVVALVNYGVGNICAG